MKPLADHGTTARAKGRPARGIKGCTCEPCRTAEAVYDKKRRYLNATGRTLMVDATPVANHIRSLFDNGAGWVQIATAASTSSATLHAILNGRITQCRRATAHKILNVKAEEVIPASRLIDATGTIRRVRALFAMGHTKKAISAASGVEQSTLTEFINAHSTVVTVHTADRVKSALRTLGGTRGTSARSLNRARLNGWAPPAAWDDETIDDPAAVPDWGETVPAYVAHVENLRELEAQGYNREQIAARLGVTRDTLQRALAFYRERYGEAA